MSAPGLVRGDGASTFAPGKLVAGRYLIVRYIAEGGMGEVYEAVDQELHERVALKTVRPESADDPDVRARFKREIQQARKVTHANMCRIWDLGVDGTVLFLTMEFLSGQTLAERLEQVGRMPLDEALPILRQVGAGLDAAHRGARARARARAAIVVGRAGRHAGLHGARAGAGRGRSAPPPTSTRSGWSCTGWRRARCRSSATRRSTAEKRLHERPRPPRAIVPDLDPRWEAVILRCLEREPTARFAHAGAAAAALDGRRRARRGWAAAALGAAAITLAAAWLAVSGHAPVRARSGRQVVAVLGLKNVAGRPEAAWLETALAEMLTTELAAARGCACSAPPRWRA
jgi:hypothetical protein